MIMNIAWKVSLLVFGFFIAATRAQSANAASEDNDVKDAGPSPRILRGMNAAEGQFPHHVSLRVYNQHLCGGAIISQNYVVTAAHCVQTFGVPLLEIRAGSTLHNSGGVVVKVAQAITQPGFKNYRNDIALLKLSEPLQFNDRIKAIPLANEVVPSGAPVIVSGWGATSNGGSIAERLQYTYMIAISFAECDSILNDLPKSEICFVPINGNGICGGDSGGPAIYNGRLVGAANWGINECGSKYPNGYSSVLHNLKWLHDNSDV